MRLRVSLVCFVLLTAIPSFGLMLYAGLHQRRAAAEGVKAEALRLARFVASDKRLSIDGTRQFLISLSRLDALRNCDSFACNTLFAKLLKQYPQYSDIGACSPDGNIFSSTPSMKGPVNVSGRSWFRQAIKARSFAFGDYRIGPITKKSSITIGYPVFDDRSRVKAVVFVALDLTWLSQLRTKVPLPENTMITLIDRNGMILARHPNPEKWVEKSMPDVPLIRTILSQKEGTAGLPGLDGIPRLYGFTPLGNWNAYASIGIPEEAAYAAVDRLLTGSLLILGFVSILALSAAWFMGDLLVLRRMRSLLRATEQVDRGNLTVRTGLPYGHGEFGQLARAFDKMVESLEERKREAVRGNREIALIAKIGQILSSTLRTEDVYKRFGRVLGRLIPFDRIAINLIDSKESTITVAYVEGVEVQSRRKGDVVPISGTATQAAVRLQQALIIQAEDEKEIATRIPGLLPAFRGGFRSMIMVPLIAKYEVVGVLHLQSLKPRAYGKKDLKLAKRVGNQIAGAIANAQLYEARRRVEEELRKVHRALKSIHGCNHALVSATNESDLFNNICRNIIETGGYCFVWIGLTGQSEEKTVRPVAQAGLEGGSIDSIKITCEGMEWEKGPMDTAIRTGKPSICKNILTDDNNTSRLQEATRCGSGSSISLPLIVNDQTCGVLNIYAIEPDSFDDEEIRLLEELARDLSYGILSLRIRAERHKTEQKMKDLEQQLFQSQKMEAIGQLAGGIAHDFNNLLTIISGNIQLSLLDLKEQDSLTENLEEIRKASERAAALTRQLLAFSRRQVLEMKVLDLNAILRDLDKMLHRIIGEDVTLIPMLSENLGRVKADQGQIEQLIVNLVVNARDAMPKGGQLTIETENVLLDEGYAHSHINTEPGPYVVLSVRDTGVGMTPEVIERIFEPFFTTKEKGQGTGLGLSMVYGIVKQSGGDICVHSEPGQGTAFTIYLPRVDELPEELGKEAKFQKISGGNETILVIEDEEAVRKMAVHFLEKLGYTVLESCGEEETLYLYQDYKGPIHLVLADVVMPKISGPQLIELLVRKRKDFKILYMSGYTDDAVVRHGIFTREINFISKPFTYSGLAEKVREVLDK